jgi:hypothetical protein
LRGDKEGEMEKIDWPKVWMEIGEAFEVPFNERKGRQLYLTSPEIYNFICVKRGGICAALGLYFNGIPYNYEEFIICLMPHLNKMDFAWIRNDKGDLLRATFCYFMAAMGQKGFKDFLEWCKNN